MTSILIILQMTRRIEVETILIRRYEHEEVTQQISIRCDPDGMVLTNSLMGQWNEVQQIRFSNDHIQTINHLWLTITENKRIETCSIANSMDQERQTFEIVHATCIEQRIHLYRATQAGIDNCTHKVAKFRAPLDC